LTGNIPEGWTLCDGTDGAPDLRDRFIAGAGGQYNSNDTGGEDNVTLTESELASHSHTGTTSEDGDHQHSLTEFDSGESGNSGPVTGDDNQGGTLSTSVNGSHTHNVTVTDTGGDQAHENRPQFYALAFIYKL